MLIRGRNHLKIYANLISQLDLFSDGVHKLNLYLYSIEVGVPQHTLLKRESHHPLELFRFLQIVVPEELIVEDKYAWLAL